MEAKVQYNDFKGTIAADGRDPENEGVLKSFLVSKGVDVDKYHPVGFDFFAAERGYCNFSIICFDTEKENLVDIGFEGKQKYEDFFNLFKRFNVVGISKYQQANGIVQEHIMIDDRE